MCRLNGLLLTSTFKVIQFFLSRRRSIDLRRLPVSRARVQPRSSSGASLVRLDEPRAHTGSWRARALTCPLPRRSEVREALHFDFYVFRIVSTAFCTTRMAPDGLKLGQRTFQTIPIMSSFDLGARMFFSIS